MTSSTENPIPTQTFLLPGQGFCIGLPWERAELPKHGLPALAPKPIVVGNVLDQKAELEGDPCAGWEIGRCEVIRRLTPGSARRRRNCASAPCGCCASPSSLLARWS